MLEYMGVYVISLAVLVVVGVLLLAAIHSRSKSSGRINTQTSSQRQGRDMHSTPAPEVMPAAFVSGFVECQEPLELYHGTALGNAFEIFDTGLWLAGPSSPRGVYLGEKVEIARQYSGCNGAIVVISADPDLPLQDRGGGVYVYEIPDAVPNQFYYRIEGLRAVGVLSPEGKRIR